MNKNHPYVDGNKRLAVTAMEAFLWLNRFVLHASNDELLDFALRVADDRLSRDESVRWVVARAERLTWPDQRFEQWIGSLTDEEWLDVIAAIESAEAYRFDGAITSAVSRVLSDG